MSNLLKAGTGVLGGGGVAGFGYIAVQFWQEFQSMQAAAYAKAVEAGKLMEHSDVCDAQVAELLARVAQCVH